MILTVCRIVNDRLGPEHFYGMVMRGNLAVVYQQLGKIDLAIGMYENAIMAMRTSIGPDHATIATTLSNLGNSLWRAGQVERAVAVQSEGLAMRRRLFGEEHPEVAQSLHNIATIRYTQERLADAEKLEREAYAIRRKVLGADHMDFAESAEILALYTLEMGDTPQATALCREALDIGRRARLPAGHWRMARMDNLLGDCLRRAGDFAGAESLLVASNAVLAVSPAIEAPQRRASLKRLAALYTAMGKPDEAARYRKQL